ncbi:putative liporotein [synthetic Mycoplasma mycoides JCVI-syn1.0]|uniref:Lipoprotein n=1 Tax=Mycoplasma mycoides subsp. capri TaxID=40477 RepID=A0AB38GEZ8_MYCMC|nr:lipoprotein [Mycoplasma mycoides]ADH21814.1 putative liporotein [synthetic Mycoplasma mycoides JCVI-syn1.0]ACU78248.1 putative liporotein [Mycoplasma mycoides subsp. capri str. GM12]ACU79078.1 putative liporotein [Mycoplasma mycoides subsp. capri str. GM12]SRX59331.1 hypothetical protein MMC68K_00865 [Mycoplasma mycoides subsp. capri]SRX62005.1 hypothetical protein MMC68I_00869 [Mycoplasma mycoides subsp. capri]
MKKLLTVLGSLMIGTSSAALVVACNNTNPSQPANKDKDENPSNGGGSEKPGEKDEDKKPGEDKKPDVEKKPTDNYNPKTYPYTIFNRHFVSGNSSSWVGTIHNSSFVNGTPAVGPNGEITPKTPNNTLSLDNVYYDSATGHDIARTYSDKRDAEEEVHRKHHAESSSKITELLFDDTIAEATYKYDLEKRKKESAEFSEAVVRNSDTINGRANWRGVSEEGRRAAEEASDWVTRNSDAINK